MALVGELLKRVAGAVDGDTREVYGRNGFRVLRTHVSSTPSEIQKRKAGLERRLRAGLPLDGGMETNGKVSGDITEDSLARAVERLGDPALRLLDEVLWFWGSDPKVGNSALAEAVDKFLNGDVDGAFAAWRRLCKGKSKEAHVAKHDRAVGSHILALEEGGDGRTPDGATLQKWGEVSASWSEWCDSGCVRAAEYLDDRVAALADPRYSKHLARQVVAALPVLVSATFARQARHWRKRRFSEAAKQLLACLGKSRLPSDAKAEAIRVAVNPLRREIESRIRAADEKRDAPSWVCLEAATRLIGEGGRLLEELRFLLPAEDSTITGLSDSVAESTVLLQVRYGSASKDWRRSEELLVAALGVAVGDAQRVRIEKELQTIRELAGDQGCWRLADQVLRPSVERSLLEAISAATKDDAWDNGIAQIEQLLRGALDEPDVVAPLERALAFMIGHRAFTNAKRASQILARPTPQLEALRARRMAFRDSGDVAGFAATLAESLQNPYAPSRCGVCNAPVGGGGVSVTIWTLDELRSLLCDSCKRAHAASVARDNKEAKPLIADALEDFTLLGEVLGDAALWKDIVEFVQKQAKSLSVSVSRGRLKKRRAQWQNHSAPSDRKDRARDTTSPTGVVVDRGCGLRVMTLALVAAVLVGATPMLLADLAVDWSDGSTPSWIDDIWTATPVALFLTSIVTAIALSTWLLKPIQGLHYETREQRGRLRRIVPLAVVVFWCLCVLQGALAAKALFLELGPEELLAATQAIADGGALSARQVMILVLESAGWMLRFTGIVGVVLIVALIVRVANTRRLPVANGLPAACSVWVLLAVAREAVVEVGNPWVWPTVWRYVTLHGPDLYLLSFLVPPMWAVSRRSNP